MKVNIGDTIRVGVEVRPMRAIFNTTGIVEGVEFTHPLGIKLIHDQEEAARLITTVTDESLITIRYLVYIEKYDIRKFIQDHEIDKQPRIVI